MFRQLIVAAATAGLIATSATVANSKSRHHGHYGYYAPSYGFSYGSGERSDPTNTNAN